MVAAQSSQRDTRCNDVDSHGNHANRDWNHANDDRGVNCDPRIGDNHDKVTAY